MERSCCAGALPAQRARSSSFNGKAHGGEAPPRLQVIGFNVFFSSSPSPAPTAAKPAISPRSALAQQLLLTQAVPACTSSSSPTQNSSPYPASPALSPTCPPAISSPSTNHNATSALPPVSSPPSTHQSCNSMSRVLKSVARSGKADADDRFDTSFISITDHGKPLGRSQFVSSPSPTNRSARVQVTTDQYSPNPSRASINQAYAAFYGETGYTEKNLCVKQPDLATEGKSSGSQLHREDEDPSSPGKSTSRSWKGVVPQVINPCSFGNSDQKTRKSSWIEESPSKKSSLFMFVASSPAPEAHHHLHLHHGEHPACEDTHFLNSCHLCKCDLGHGKDVFMYRGDKAFCSIECRYQQIVIDERKERCPPRIIRSGAVSTQVYQHDQISTASPSSTTHVHLAAISKSCFINMAAAA